MDEATSQRIDELERKLAAMQRTLVRRDGRRRWWAGAIGLVAFGAPLFAWTYTKPHPDFEPGTPISSVQVNETVDDVYAALNTLDAETARVAARTVIDTVGALPVGGGFESQGGSVVLLVSGSAFRGSEAGMVGVDVLVDGASVGSARTYTNEISSHKALVSAPLILADLPEGPHTVDLEPLPNTVTDFNDPFVVVALELPR
jgi:hypothetical protein